MSAGAKSGDDDPIWLADFLESRDELLAFLRRKAGPGHQPADLLHDVFVRMWKARIREPLQNPRAYLFRTAANVAIDAVRADRRRLQVSGEAEKAMLYESDPAPDALRVSIGRERLRRLDDALAELPEETRAMVYLTRVEGRGVAEVARMFGMAKSTVEKRVSKALVHCRAALDRGDAAGD